MDLPNIPECTAQEALSHLEGGETLFVDIRDPGSYSASHIPGAIHVNDHNVAEFIANTPKSNRVIVYCYHGNSSMGATHYFMSQGFEDVASMSGGFAHWALVGPVARD